MEREKKLLAAISLQLGVAEAPPYEDDKMTYYTCKRTELVVAIVRRKFGVARVTAAATTYIE